jgi:hypothetical protein
MTAPNKFVAEVHDRMAVIPPNAPIIPRLDYEVQIACQERSLVT